MAILTEKNSTPSSHWYTEDGEPRHFIGRVKDGELRPTTLRDARKERLYPSITSILGVMEKETLKRWQFRQIAFAASRQPIEPNESEDYFIERVMTNAFQVTSDAADLGTQIHAAIEAKLAGEHFDPNMDTYVDPALEWLDESMIEAVELEKVVVDRENGFAGTCDYIGRAANGTPIVLDWKSRKTKPGAAVKSWDGQMMQIAGYAKAYWGQNVNVAGANVVISTTEPGRVEVIRYTPRQLNKAYQALTQLCAVWRYIKGYDPRKDNDNE